jgi:hypothetical protein
MRWGEGDQSNRADIDSRRFLRCIENPQKTNIAARNICWHIFPELYFIFTLSITLKTE